MDSSLSSQRIEEVKELLQQDKKLRAIKNLREKDRLTLKEAKQKVEEIETQLIRTGQIEDTRKGCGMTVLLVAIVALGMLVN